MGVIQSSFDLKAMKVNLAKGSFRFNENLIKKPVGVNKDSISGDK